jgi:hypothetical protein
VLSIQDLSAGYRGLLSGRDEGFEYRTWWPWEIPQPPPFHKVRNCWGGSDRSETYRQSTWAPQFFMGTELGAIPTHTIRFRDTQRVACVLPLDASTGGSMQLSRTCLAHSWTELQSNSGFIKQKGFQGGCRSGQLTTNHTINNQYTRKQETS